MNPNMEGDFQICISVPLKVFALSEYMMFGFLLLEINFSNGKVCSVLSFGKSCGVGFR